MMLAAWNEAGLPCGAGWVRTDPWPGAGRAPGKEAAKVGPSGTRKARGLEAARPGWSPLGPALAYSASVTATGTWSEVRGQSRASASTVIPCSAGTRSCDTQTWSSRRPRSDARQSRLRYDHHV